jgi:hypothetical protein
MQQIIGLLGAKGAGKDTAASHLVSTCDFIRVAFADKLYREVAEAFGVTVELLGRRDTKESDLAEFSLRNCSDPSFVQCVAEELGTTVTEDFLAKPRSPRFIMQLWGTEYRRKRGVDSYWLDQVAAIMDADPARSYVVTDVRFPNEALFIKARNGMLVRVRRPELELREAVSRAANGTAAHPSETAMLNYPVDAEVQNPEGSPQTLFAGMDELLNEVPA